MKTDIQVSDDFLIALRDLTKTAIKIYILLCYKKAKVCADDVEISHSNLRLMYINNDFTAVCSDYPTFLKALKELEAKSLIEVYRANTARGKPLTNIYTIL